MVILFHQMAWQGSSFLIVLSGVDANEFYESKLHLLKKMNYFFSRFSLYR